jgi:hypothetical protein
MWTTERPGLVDPPPMPTRAELARLAEGDDPDHPQDDWQRELARRDCFRTFLESERELTEASAFGLLCSVDVTRPLRVVEVPGAGAGPKGNLLFSWEPASRAADHQPFGTSQLDTASRFGLPDEWLEASDSPRSPTGRVMRGLFACTFVAPLIDPLDGEVIFRGGALQLVPGWFESGGPALEALERPALVERLDAISQRRGGVDCLDRAVRWLERLSDPDCGPLDCAALARGLGWIAHRVLRLVERDLAEALLEDALGVALDADARERRRGR